MKSNLKAPSLGLGYPPSNMSVCIKNASGERHRLDGDRAALLYMKLWEFLGTPTAEPLHVTI